MHTLTMKEIRKFGGAVLKIMRRLLWPKSGDALKGGTGGHDDRNTVRYELRYQLFVVQITGCCDVRLLIAQNRSSQC